MPLFGTATLTIVAMLLVVFASGRVRLAVGAMWGIALGATTLL